MTTDGLFDLEPAVLPAPVKVSADRRRTLRQAQAITHGVHPLALVFPWVRMLPDADRTASPDDAKDLPLRCGSCRLRQLLDYHGKAYPKCLTDDGFSGERYERQPPRVSHSTATDVRAWWPACTAYQPGDPRLSPDAARGIPS